MTRPARKSSCAQCAGNELLRRSCAACGGSGKAEKPARAFVPPPAAIPVAEALPPKLGPFVDPQHALEDVWGFQSFRSGQLEVIESVLAGEDVIGILPTSAGKCLDPRSFVWSDGLRRFGDLYGTPTTIRAPQTVRRISGWVDDGAKPGFKVTLRCGLQLNGSPPHKLWVRSPGGFEGWKRLDALNQSDFVAVARGRADFGAVDIPAEDAYALGLVVADGTLIYALPAGHVFEGNDPTTKDEIAKSVTLRIDKQRPVLEAVYPTIRRWQLEVSSRAGISTRIKDTSANHSVLFSGGRGWMRFFKNKFGLDFQYSENKTVPTCVLRGTRDVVRNFLRGYIDGDGWCDTAVHTSSASRELSEQIHALLLGLGISSFIHVKPTGKLPAHIVTVGDTAAFDREIGITRYGLTKDRNYEALLSRGRQTNVDVIPYLGGTLREARKSYKVSKNDVPALKHIDAYYASRNATYWTLETWLRYLPDSPAKRDMQRIYNDHYLWSQVTKIEPSTIQRIDCEVEEEHAYIANGMVSHNSLLFQLPSVMRLDRPVLVMSPLIALMRDQVAKAQSVGIPAVAITSQHTPAQVAHSIAQMPRASLIYAAPERFEDPRFLLMLRQNPPWLVAMDESHMAEEAGLSYRPAYRFAREMLDLSARTSARMQWLALTASATEGIVEDLRTRFRMENARLFRFSCDRPNLSYRVRPVIESEKYGWVRRLLKDELEGGGAAIVYTLKRKDAEEVAARLCGDDIAASHYHAGMKPKERRSVEEDFFGKRIDIVVATCAFGMGIDRSDVRLVLMHGMPKSIEDYYQMAGRGGRDGKPSKAIALYDSNRDYSFRKWLVRNGRDLENNRYSERYGFTEEKFAESQERQLELLRQLDRFLRSHYCRAQLLREYFGEAMQTPCGNCDNCKAYKRG